MGQVPRSDGCAEAWQTVAQGSAQDAADDCSRDDGQALIAAASQRGLPRHLARASASPQSLSVARGGASGRVVRSSSSGRHVRLGGGLLLTVLTFTNIGELEHGSLARPLPQKLRRDSRLAHPRACRKNGRATASLPRVCRQGREGTAGAGAPPRAWQAHTAAAHSRLARIAAVTEVYGPNLVP